MQRFTLEKHHCEHGEYHKRDCLLHHLELHESEWSAVAHKTDAVGGHLTEVFKEGDAPREENDDQQGPVFADAGGLEPQVTVPSEGHEDVGEDEQNEGI